MSLKDLFKLGENLNVSAPAKSLDQVGREVESAEYATQQREDQSRFVPHVDFRYPANFAKYGSAAQYYEDSIKRIYNTYPYDGSLREKTEWHNSSSFLDKFIFDQKYPKTNGYINLSVGGWGTLDTMIEGYGIPATSEHEYIQVKGGPHPDPDETKMVKAFPGLHEGNANFWDAQTRRKSNLALNQENGFSVEFWLKKTAFTLAKTQKEVVFDLWNGEASGSVGCGRLTIELTGASGASPFLVTVQSGTDGYFQQSIGSGITTTTLQNWHHFAFTFSGSSNNVETKFYIDGDLNHQLNTGTSIKEVTGSLIANIGALRTAPTFGESGKYSNITEGYGKLSGSLDEFRFWTKKRSSKEINKYWFTQIAGGTNTDVALTGAFTNKYNEAYPVDLGVYYKFNEGITGTGSVDGTVLDYSGRLSNGSWTGYVSSNSRATGSAMIEAGAATREIKDPIIYRHHPEVNALLNNLWNSGSAYDLRNNSGMYHTLPSWVTEEDQEVGGNTIKKLTQIMSSYFDSLHLQIENLPKIKDKDYVSASFKPLPFTERLLDHAGFVSPDILTQATELENLASRDNVREFDEKIYDIKNHIYKNIYNNLTYIYKSKGTEKAFRNLIRCFGVDDELIKLNLYANNTTHEIKDNYRITAHRKKYAAFNNPSHFGATIYQSSSGKGNNELSYISGSGAGLLSTTAEYWMPWTIEAEAIFPDRPAIGIGGYYTVPFVSSSLFGAHEAVSASSDFTWGTNDNCNFQVYSVREEVDSNNARFVLKSSLDGWPTIQTKIYEDVYDNQKWNFAVRFYVDKTNNTGLVKPQGRLNNLVIDSEQDVNPYIEFYGVNSVSDQIINEFHLTASLFVAYTGSADVDPTVNKRIYAGAHRTNFNGGLLTPCDSKISSVRYWQSYLENDVIRAHSRDASNFGTLHPYRNTALTTTSLSGVHVPAMETLALHWDFDNVTGSDANGVFSVEDYSSGSAALASGSYAWLGNIVKNQHRGRGQFFLANTTASISNEYVHSAKQRLPESLDSDNMVNILTQDDEKFTRESRPITHFFAVEKSMYQTISEEMINFFATITDFNNLIGEPVNRYRQDYKDMEKIRQLFFERVRNEPSLERYINFYKWIDSSISKMILQLVPASANMSERLRNVVESHVLERNKYWTKFPTLEFKVPELEAGLRGVTELLYNWKYGHASFPESIVFSEDFGTSAGAVDSTYWQAASADIKIVRDTTADTHALVIQGRGLAGGTATGATTDRWIRTVRKYRAPLTVEYKYIGGGTGTNYADAYDSSGLNLKRPEYDTVNPNARDSLYFQYSTDGISWTTVTEHKGWESGGDYVGGVWKGTSANITGGKYVYLRWFQDHFANINEDHWALDDIKIYSPTRQNCFWWQERAAASNAHITSGDTEVDNQRDIYNAADKHRSGSGPNLSRKSEKSSYAGSTYALNRFTKPYRFNVDKSKNLHGGVNFYPGKKLDYANIATPPFGKLLTIGSPEGITGVDEIILSVNYLLVQSAETRAGAGDEVDAIDECSDVLDPLRKRKYNYNVRNSRENRIAGGYSYGKGELLLPFNIHSSSVDTGYAKEIADSNFGKSLESPVDFTNIHVDAYGPNNEVPMQGPFTEKFVGGRQNRHVDVNTYDFTPTNDNTPVNRGLDHQGNRTEAWYIIVGGGDPALGIVGPTYTATGVHDKHVPRATRMREDFVKRPVNIRNIQQTTGSGIGNYESNWNVVSTTGRTQNNAYFKENGGVSLPARFDLENDNLPATTHVHSLFGVNPSIGTQATAMIAFKASAFAAVVGDTITLTDAEGNTVVFKFANNSTLNGSLHSDGTSINVGVSGDGGVPATRANNFATVVNLVTSYSNGKTLNITAALNLNDCAEVFPSTSCAATDLTMDTPGSAGNTSISISSPGGEIATNDSTFTGGHFAGNISTSQPESLNSLSNRFASDTDYTLPRRDLTGSNSVIVSRFSAPGGPEVMSRGYLDIAAEEYSVHNALPYRNLSVRGSGSGEVGTIRMSVDGKPTESALRDREGLRTRLTRHSGQFGLDSQWGRTQWLKDGHDEVPSLHKVNRNPLKRIKETS
jgi:hypothetical protein